MPPPPASKYMMMKNLHPSALGARRSLLQACSGDAEDRAIRAYFIYVSRATRISPVTSPNHTIPAPEFTGYRLHGKEGCPLQKGWQNGGLALLMYDLTGKYRCIQKYQYPEISKRLLFQEKTLVSKSVFLFSEVCSLRCQKKKLQLKSVYQFISHGMVLAGATLRHENHVDL